MPDQSTQIFDLKLSLAIAIERTGVEPFNCDKMALDLVNEFRNVSSMDIKKAIRNGSLGKYGRTYRLSPQEICIWVREYLKENPKLTKTNQI